MTGVKLKETPKPSLQKDGEPTKDQFSIPLLYSPDNPPALKPPRVLCHLDEEHAIRHMVYVGVIHHEQLVEEIVKIWEQIEDLERYDNLIDMRFHKGDVGWHTVKEIGKRWNLFFNGDAPKKRTAFISKDITFTILIKAIQAFAPEHTFQAFRTKEDALEWLLHKT